MKNDVNSFCFNKSKSILMQLWMNIRNEMPAYPFFIVHFFVTFLRTAKISPGVCVAAVHGFSIH